MTEDFRGTPGGSGRWDASGSHLPAWEDLYRKHYKSTVSLARFLGADMATAQDVAQEAFIVLQKAVGPLREERVARAYLRTTTARMVVRQMRQQRERPVPWYVLDQVSGLAHMASAEMVALAQEEISASAEVLLKLPRRQREVLSLAMLEHSPAEIAAVLGIEANAVRVHLHHGRARVRALLRSEPIAS